MFVGTAVDEDELEAAHANPDSGSYYSEIEGENRRKMAACVRDLAHVVSRSASIIDIGTGNGLFVELLAGAGFTDVSAHERPGADLSHLARIARRVYLDADYRTVPSASFDAVTLLDVAEHVVDPGLLFAACSRILRPHGLLYLHTPIVTRLDRLMHAGHKLPVVKKLAIAWQRGRTSIFHLQNYTPKSLALVLEASGFGEITTVVRNELSWPVRYYAHVYLVEKQGFPTFTAPVVAPLLRPFLASGFFNANKAIVMATKGPAPA